MKPDRRLRLTLVSIHPSRSPQSVPLAAAFLAAAIKNSPGLTECFVVTLLNLYADQSADACAAEIESTRPDLAGFSVYAWNRCLSTVIAIQLKNHRPGVTLFCGGPEATADQAGMLMTAPWEFLVHGDGELPLIETLQALCAEKSPAGIPGIATLHNGSMQSSPRPPADPVGLPSPLLSAVIDPADYSGMLWQISRGCSFGCEFCFDGGGNRLVRRFTLERIEAELRWLAEKGVSQVFVLDSTFNSDRNRAVRILELIRKIAPRIHFHFEVRSEFIDRKQAELFAAITCSLQIGLQSADSVVLKNSGRNFNPSEFRTKIALLNDTGAIFGFDLIYGLPGDTPEKFRKSLDFALKLYPNHLDIFPLAILPGTELAKRQQELSLNHLTSPPYTLQSSPTFTEKDMAAAADLAAACDIFYSRGKAVSWFMNFVHPLKLKPSEVLELVAACVRERRTPLISASEADDEEIFHFQKDFVTRLYTEKGLKKLIPAAIDMITYNFHYAAALMASPPPRPSPRELQQLNIETDCPEISPSTRLARFSYEILDILESGIADLRLISSTFPRKSSAAIIYPGTGDVLTESLPEQYLSLLENLDGKTAALAVAERMGIGADDALSFLRLAFSEGIVSLTRRV